MSMILQSFVIALFILWSLFWKAWALWVAARRDERLWFIALLVFNTAGILETFYPFVLGKRKGRV